MIPTVILLGMIAGAAAVVWAQGDRRQTSRTIRVVAAAFGAVAILLTLAFFVGVNGSAGIGSINFVLGAAFGCGLTALVRVLARRTN